MSEGALGTSGTQVKGYSSFIAIAIMIINDEY